jgi:serine protease Do
VQVSVWRKGATRELSVTVAEMQPEQQARTGGGNRPPQGPAPGAQQSNALGLVVADIPEERRTQLRIKNGVLVETAEGAAARAGLRPGDVILSLNNQDVTGAKQFNEAVSKLDRTKTHIMLVRRGESAQFVPIRPQGQGGQ